MLSLQGFPIPSIDNTSTFSSASKHYKQSSSFLPCCAPPKRNEFNVFPPIQLPNIGKILAPVLKNVAKDLSETEELPAGLERDLMPKHVAVIFDDSEKWVRHRGLQMIFDYMANARSLLRIISLCSKWGIEVLTLSAMFYENLIPSQMEVDIVMTLFGLKIKSKLDQFLRNGIRISVTGDLSKLPISLQRLIDEAEETTKNNSRLHLIFAVGCDGRQEIVQACKTIAYKVKNGLIQLEDINKSLIEQEMKWVFTRVPVPDLLIRTSGECRIDNFLLWHLTCTELFFTGTSWSDFGEFEFKEALSSFQQRQRKTL